MESPAPLLLCINCGSVLAPPRESVQPSDLQCIECGMGSTARTQLSERIQHAARWTQAGIAAWASVALLYSALQLALDLRQSTSAVGSPAYERFLAEQFARFSLFRWADLLLAVAALLVAVRVLRVVRALPAASTRRRMAAAGAVAIVLAEFGAILIWRMFYDPVAAGVGLGPLRVPILLLAGNARAAAAASLLLSMLALRSPGWNSTRARGIAWTAIAGTVVLGLFNLVYLRQAGGVLGASKEWTSLLLYGPAALNAAVGIVGLWTVAAAQPVDATAEPSIVAQRTHTLADAMHNGGVPVGALLGAIGVLSWVVYETPITVDKATQLASVPGWATHWLVLRWSITAAVALAWVIPAYLVPNRPAARVWRWSAVATVAASMLLGAH